MANSSHASILLVLLLVSIAGCTSGAPWTIMKSVSYEDVASKELKLSHADVYNHVLPYWRSEVSTAVGQGQRVVITVRDLTDPKTERHYTKGMYLKSNKDPANTFQLEWPGIVRKWTPYIGERVGLYAENTNDGPRLNVKLFGRAE